MAMGSPSSLASHRWWKKISACARVLWKISVVRWARISARISGMAWRPPPPAQGGALGVQHGDVGVGAGIGDQDPGPGPEKAGQRRRVLDRGRQADAAQAGGQALQAGQQQRQLIAAPRFGQRVDLVDDDPRQAGEDPRGVVARQQQRQAFRRGQQDMRRIGALAPALRVGGVSPVRSSTRMAGRALDWPASGCGGYRRSAPSAARCKACAARDAGAGPSSASVGRKPASVLPPPVGAMRRVAGASAASSMACWWGCSAQPRPANQRRAPQDLPPAAAGAAGSAPRGGGGRGIWPSSGGGRGTWSQPAGRLWQSRRAFAGEWRRGQFAAPSRPALAGATVAA
jgi:hypothetical protein